MPWRKPSRQTTTLKDIFANTFNQQVINIQNIQNYNKKTEITQQQMKKSGIVISFHQRENTAEQSNHVKSCSLIGSQGNAEEHGDMLFLHSVYKRPNNMILTTLEDRNYHVNLDTS